MIIGVPKEIKTQEYRVGIVPAGVAELVRAGHEVLIERGAGLGAGFTDQEYERQGGVCVSTEEAWHAQLVVKVKEPLAAEYDYLHGQILFTFLHLAGVDINLTRRLMASGTTAIAYETLEDDAGRLPILAPMSAVAGNMAALVGAYYLARFNQGNGVQLGQVLGRRHGKALVLGAGVVGMHAARTLHGMGTNVYLAGLDKHKVDRQVSEELAGVNYFYSNDHAVAQHCVDADLVIGAVLKRGQKAPYVLTEKMVSAMGKSSVIVDVSIDQGGCVETSRATTHDQPVYTRHGVIHYCVTNMPGAYPRSSAVALCAESLPYVRLLADKGVDGFLGREGLAKAVNIYRGEITNEKLAESLSALS